MAVDEAKTGTAKPERAPRLSHRCGVCSHTERFRIEMLKAGGASSESLAEKFGVSHDAIWRHWRRHVSPDKKAQYLVGPVKRSQMAELAAAENLALVDYLRILRSTLLAMFSATSEAGDAHAAAALSGRLLDVLREIGKITGEITRASSIVVNNNVAVLISSPFFTDLEASLVKLAARHPQARSDIVAILRELESAHGGGTPPLVERQAGAPNVAA